MNTLVLVTARDRKVASNKAAAERLADEIRTKNLAKELIGARIKLECWDAMEVQKKEVRNLCQYVPPWYAMLVL